MKSIQALREERKTIAAQMDTLVNQPDDHKWNDDDQKKFDDFRAAVENIDKDDAREKLAQSLAKKKVAA